MATRSRRSRAEWARLVTQWKRSGETAAEFAIRMGVNRSTLKWWASRLTDEELAVGSLVAVRAASALRSAPSRPLTGACVRLPDGIEVGLSADVEPHQIAAVARALQEAGCASRT